MPQTLAIKSIETELLEKYLLEHQADPLISYASLAAVIAEDVRTGRGYARLKSARDGLLRDHQILFVNVPKAGWKRADNTEVLATGGNTLRTIHRAAHRGVKRFKATRIGDLTNDQKHEFNATASLLGAVMGVTTTQARTKLLGVVQQTTDKLPVAKTLAALSAAVNGNT
jgi:hypothetical protein